MIEQFVEDVLNSGEDAMVWLHTTAGLDIATPCMYIYVLYSPRVYGEYLHQVPGNHTLDWKYYDCKKTSLEASLENQTLNVWCQDGSAPIAKFQVIFVDRLVNI